MLDALAKGMTQSQVAKDFNVNRNTVYTLVKRMREVKLPENPIGKWTDTVRPRVHSAIERALDYDKDVIGSANVGLKILYGTGELSNTGKVEVSGNVAITFAWQPVQEPEFDAIDVTHSTQVIDSTNDK